MTYRCPYCKQQTEGEPQPACPSCGKTMVVPKMRESTARTIRQRTIDNLWREAEQKKAGLHGVVTPKTFRNPKVYLGLILFLALIGILLSTATDKAVKRKQKDISPELRTLRNLDVLAEALGRYHFHCGAYPTIRQGGLGALIRDPWGKSPGWNGPYISHLPKDAWDTPFAYAPPSTPGGLPALFSCGPDRQPNTPDDLKPDPARFDPGTEWTNGWTRAEDRLPGVTIVK